MKNELDKELVRQARLLLQMLSQFQEEQSDFSEYLEKASLEGITPAPWAGLHELSTAQLGNIYAEFFGGVELGPLLREADDPLQTLMNLAQERSAEIDAWEMTDEERDELKEVMPGLLALLLSASANTNAMMQRGRTLSDMVQAVKEGGDGAEEALMEALVTDPAMASNPTLAGYHSQSLLRSEEGYLKRFVSAMTGKKPVAKDTDHNHLRFLLFWLKETGQLDGLSDKRLITLFCTELGVYGEQGSGEDHGDSLIRFVRRWKKEASY